jgi:hypothetical protein
MRALDTPPHDGASAADLLSQVTQRADEGGAPGDGEALWRVLRGTRIEATGPDYWR